MFHCGKKNTEMLERRHEQKLIIQKRGGVGGGGGESMNIFRDKQSEQLRQQ